MPNSTLFSLLIIPRSFLRIYIACMNGNYVYNLILFLFFCLKIICDPRDSFRLMHGRFIFHSAKNCRPSQVVLRQCNMNPKNVDILLQLRLYLLMWFACLIVSGSHTSACSNRWSDEVHKKPGDKTEDGAREEGKAIRKEEKS